MRHHRVLLAGWLALAPTAAGQTAINAQLASPVSSQTFFVTPDAALAPSTFSGGAGVSLDYGRLPLAYHTAAGETTVISDLLTADLVAHLAVARRVKLELTLPFNASSSGGAYVFSGLGDARASLQVTLVDPSRHALGVALRPFVTLPTGDTEANLGEGSLSPGGYLVAHRQGEKLQAAAALGARFLTSQSGGGSRELLLGSVGVSVPLDSSLRLGLELFGATPLLEPFVDPARSPIEVLGSAHYRVRPGVVASIGGGTALTEGAGGPRFRAFGQLSAVFPSGGGDRDADGIVDRVDGCPAEGEDRDGHEDGDGCPELDNDGDGLADAEDQCPESREDADGFLDRDGCPDPDNDGDGIADTDDGCTAAAEDPDGFEDGDGCPDSDNDHDGFLDVEDDCPVAAEDFDGFQDRDGCADPDNDGDQIVDAKDRCPGEAEDPNGREDSDGCPDEEGSVLVSCVRNQNGECLEPGAPLPVNERLTLAVPILFALDSAELSTPARAALDQLVQRVRGMPEGQRLRIAGHCDDLGSDEYNDALSLMRAESVKAYLVARGVDAERLETIGYGRRNPVAKGISDLARQQNRRVQLWVLEGRSRRPVAVPIESLQSSRR